MDYTPLTIRKFIYSGHFYSGLRRAIGGLLPALVLVGIFDLPLYGLTASFGALCVSIADQPGPLRHRTNELFGCALLSCLVVGITALATSYGWLLWIAVIGQCILFSLFTAFGRQAGLIGFACLIIMTLTMHTQIPPNEAGQHALLTLAGGLWYAAFALTISHFQWHREERQAIALCMFTTADYLEAKSRFYDARLDIDECYRNLIERQAAVVEQQQAARNVVLRGLPRASANADDARRVMLFNLFISVIDLHETVVAVHTDYGLLRRSFQDSDVLIFMRDLVRKASKEVEDIGLALTQNRPSRQEISTKAELRALEYEIELLKSRDFPNTDPDAYAALISTFRRLRNSLRIIDRLHANTDPKKATTALLDVKASFERFLSHETVTAGLLWSNLRLSSPNMRHALRVALAAAIVMTMAGTILEKHHLEHAYWILLTALIILKPGFSLSKQRNVQRLVGTLVGCVITIGILLSVHSPLALLGIMVVSSIMANSLAILNFFGSSVFTTAFALIGLHFLSPGWLSLTGERALDTVLGSAIAFLCSYFLPYWEFRQMRKLLAAAITANRNYLERAVNTFRGLAPDAKPSPSQDLEYRLARSQVHTAYANFASAFYRMMQEPRSKQVAVAELNNLLIQTHVFASQVTAIAPLLSAVPATSPKLEAALSSILDNLRAAEAGAPASPIRSFDALEADKEVSRTDDTTADNPAVRHELQQLGFQLKLLARSAELIRQDASAARLPG
ncbi:FUSC family protein [Pigmentiphaga aceris]|nr:FUSC family protein [Pigmentiphaga aceris]